MCFKKNIAGCVSKKNNKNNRKPRKPWADNVSRQRELTFSGKYAVTSLWLLCAASLFVFRKTSFSRPNNTRFTHALISALHSIENCCRIKLPQKNFFGIKWLCNPGRVWGPCLLQLFTSYQYHMTEDNLFYAQQSGAILCGGEDGTIFEMGCGLTWEHVKSDGESGCRELAFLKTIIHRSKRKRQFPNPSYFPENRSSQ